MLLKVADVADLVDGSMKKVMANGNEILLARVGGQLYALDNKCPHMGGDLSAGTLEGSTVTCPRHGSQFDVRTGQNLRWTKFTGLAKTAFTVIKSPRPAKTYKVQVSNGDISIEI